MRCARRLMCRIVGCWTCATCFPGLCHLCVVDLSIPKSQLPKFVTLSATYVFSFPFLSCRPFVLSPYRKITLLVNLPLDASVERSNYIHKTIKSEHLINHFFLKKKTPSITCWPTAKTLSSDFFLYTKRCYGGRNLAQKKICELTLANLSNWRLSF